AQSFVKSVSSGVASSQSSPANLVNIGVYWSTNTKSTFSKSAAVNNQILDWSLNVVNFQNCAVVGNNLTLISNLTTALSIEWRAIKNNFNVCRSANAFNSTLTGFNNC
ncbi:hypothetical protein QP239_24445, partial [Escherichia coli]|nr:hypothetical protein [Escherichia coli]